MMRADIYITNLSKTVIAVANTSIKPGKTKKILPKDFDRKASYIDRMIKEGKIAISHTPAKTGESDEKAPEATPEPEGADASASPAQEDVVAGKTAPEPDKGKADASHVTQEKQEEEEPEAKKKTEAKNEEDEAKPEKEPSETKEESKEKKVSSPRTRAKRK